MLSMELAKKIIGKIYDFIKINKLKKVSFIWHGGEPLIWGKSNFEQIFEYTKILMKDIRVNQSIQTNLTLIDKEYIDIFKQYDVKVGFSIDGTKNLNDKTRIYGNGNGSFDLIFRKIQLCLAANINLGAIVVANANNINHVRDIYTFMNDLKINFRLNPLFKSGEANNTFDELGITPSEYSRAMIDLFDLWTSSNTNIRIDSFTEIAGNMVTGCANSCSFKENCQDFFTSIDSQGNIFPCGRFCGDNNFIFGNIIDSELNEIISYKRDYFAQKRNLAYQTHGCVNCRYLKICNGGCMHDAYIQNRDLFSKTGLCEAYMNLFSHIENYLISNKINTYITEPNLKS